MFFVKLIVVSSSFNAFGFYNPFFCNCDAAHCYTGDISAVYMSCGLLGWSS